MKLKYCVLLILKEIFLHQFILMCKFIAISFFLLWYSLENKPKLLWRTCHYSNRFKGNYAFLLPFLSPMLEWAFLIKVCLLSAVVVGVNLSHFHFLQNPWSYLNQTLHTNYWRRGCNFVRIKDNALFSGKTHTAKKA